ncbi:MAG: ArnT family glycosyltransferase, partial [Verrucomicrobiota bacterium]
MLLVFLGLVAVAFQWGAGAYRQEFGGHPDEAAHFITALMIHDYLASAAGSHPMRFAERYYEHYPKVALGHWPPVFYVVQAGWMLVWGVSRAAALGLLAVVGVLTARLLAGTVARCCGWVSGLGAALLWLSVPLVQIHTGMVMADLPVTLIMLLAVIALGRFLEAGRARDALAFGVWSGLAILTKGSAMALALVVPSALVLSGRYAVLRRPVLWGSAAVVAVLAGPWTAYFQSVNKEGWADTPWWQFVRQALPYYPRVLVQQVGVLGIGLAVLLTAWHGVWMTLVAAGVAQRVAD